MPNPLQITPEQRLLNGANRLIRTLAIAYVANNPQQNQRSLRGQITALLTQAGKDGLTPQQAADTLGKTGVDIDAAVKALDALVLDGVNDDGTPFVKTEGGVLPPLVPGVTFTPKSDGSGLTAVVA